MVRVTPCSCQPTPRPRLGLQLLRMDPASGAFEELWLSARQWRTPLTAAGSVTDMLRPARDRLLMRIKWKTACGLEIWEWRPAAKSLACIQDNSTRDNVYWLPSSRNHAQVGDTRRRSCQLTTRLQTCHRGVNQRFACYGDTVFTLEFWWVSKRSRAPRCWRARAAPSPGAEDRRRIP